jgi:hypothetical protein
MFAWDHDYPSVQGVRKQRTYLVYNPSFTAKGEVIWTMEGDSAKARRSNEQVAHQAVGSLLGFIRERIQGLDDFPGAYQLPYEM